MDASKLTRLRREAANNWIHTTDTVDASETTRKRKLQASQFFNCNINANPTICYVPFGNGSNAVPHPAPMTQGSPVLSLSYDDIMFRNAGWATCCNASSKPIIMGVSTAWYLNRSQTGYVVDANSSFTQVCQTEFNGTLATRSTIIAGLPSTTCLTDYYNYGNQ